MINKSLIAYNTFAHLECRGKLDSVIAEYDTDGNLLWIKNFGGISNESAELVVTEDDGYLIAGSAHTVSFGTGDFESLTQGEDYADAYVLKMDFEGNIVWIKAFGVPGQNDEFYDVASSEDGYVFVGQAGFGGYVLQCDKNGKTVSENFRTYEEIYYSVICTDDKIIAVDGRDKVAILELSLLDVFESQKYIRPQDDVLAISGRTDLHAGDRVTVPLYFKPSENVRGIEVKLSLPSCLTFEGFVGDNDNISFREFCDGDVCTISCSGTFDDIVKSGELCVVGWLSFSVKNDAQAGAYSITADKNSFAAGEKNLQVFFGGISDYTFNIRNKTERSLRIIGGAYVNSCKKYDVAFSDDLKGKAVKWSIPDETAATVSDSGIITPFKNGEVVVLAECDGVVAERTLTVEGMDTTARDFSFTDGVLNLTLKNLKLYQGNDEIFVIWSVFGADKKLLKCQAQHITDPSSVVEVELDCKEFSGELTVRFICLKSLNSLIPVVPSFSVIVNN